MCTLVILDGLERQGYRRAARRLEPIRVMALRIGQVLCGFGSATITTATAPMRLCAFMTFTRVVA